MASATKSVRLFIILQFIIFPIVCSSHIDKTHPEKNEAISANKPLDKETSKSYWLDAASETLEGKLQKEKKRTAKNIIFFLGDGMSISTITAARIYQGQLQNRTGEEEKLFFETFPVSGLAKTYCTNAQVPDSACTATAFMSGIKCNKGTIGVTKSVERGDCEAGKNRENHPTTLIRWAQDAGKATGIVTTARITHATPAGAYAHVADRDFECDTDIAKSNNITFCDSDIAKQLILDEPGKNIKVLMGGGRTKFIPKEHRDITGYGERSDGIDLIEKWKEDKKNKNANSTFIYNLDQLKGVDVKKTEYLLGLLEASHVNYNLRSEEKNVLALMTKTAIEILKKSEKGFVLFIEGGRIDMAHHDNLARTALDETVQLAKAVEIASNMTNEDDTLIVVTADHSHVMTMNGYPVRGADILKFAEKTSDGLPYTTLSYANGPGYHPEINSKRYNLTDDDFGNIMYAYPAMVPRDSDTHSGEDVAVYAKGPWSQLFTGTYEQNYIPLAEAFAADINPFRKSKIKTNSATSINIHCSIPIIYIFILAYIITR